MQTIKTKILPATNTKPTRIKATAEDLSIVWMDRKRTVTISSWNGNIEDGYKKAAYQLKISLGWTEKMIGGHTRDGMIFVFFNENYLIE